MLDWERVRMATPVETMTLFATKLHSKATWISYRGFRIFGFIHDIACHRWLSDEFSINFGIRGPDNLVDALSCQYQRRVYLKLISELGDDYLNIILDDLRQRCRETWLANQAELLKKSSKHQLVYDDPDWRANATADIGAKFLDDEPPIPADYKQSINAPSHTIRSFHQRSITQRLADSLVRSALDPNLTAPGVPHIYGIDWASVAKSCEAEPQENISVKSTSTPVKGNKP